MMLGKPGERPAERPKAAKSDKWEDERNFSKIEKGRCIKYFRISYAALPIILVHFSSHSALQLPMAFVAEIWNQISSWRHLLTFCSMSSII
jgi:hypothetical protein